MKKIFHRIIITLLLTVTILTCTNPNLQDFTTYEKKVHGSNKASNETIKRESYFIFNTYRQSGGGAIDKNISRLHLQVYWAIRPFL